jgi:uncharacterized protein DUF3618
MVTNDNSTPDAPPDMAELQADIERTRADLADTVDQLAAKLDVKSRVRTSVGETKDRAVAELSRLQDRATDDRGKPTPATLGIGGGVLAAAVAVLVVALWRRHSSPGRRGR